ncbi:TadE/TadG family type IV pilus assembly protein [Isoptericola sp. b490]|uniref:TadE/TadG family type IV pilus assembly protein n=1 Tax=Actinotalea lenta TaxID=3064654 RepID=UPI00271254BF|nr:TadE/TadG family type IV pilus assembly protein [Isoptericola sp. b490]MDO8119703.1 TadE/TadG family type IV pilus assembly protein [Isoptericola sp. b490]
MPALRARLRPVVRRDDGSASLELAIVFPVLLLVVLALLQYGLWFHARTLAQAAAAEGVAVARSYSSTPEAGRVRATTFLADHAEDLVLDPVVVASVPSTGHVAVEVRGHSLSLLPFVAGPVVVQSAQGPVERFTVPGAP